MIMVDKVVSLPQSAVVLSEGIQKFVLSAIAAHKAGGGPGVELPTDLAAAVADLLPLLGSLGSVPADAMGDFGGFAEPFVMAGFAIERALLVKP